MFGASGGGGLFGSTPSSGGGLFGGAPASGGGLFGAPASSGGGLFGSPASSGGMFGAAAPAGGGMFGGQQTGGGMFGSAAPSGGLFGQSSGGGMFGAAPASGGGLFGAPAAAPANPNAMEANFKQIGEQFAQAYYQTYDAKQNLATFYEENSLFTFEGQDIQGAQNIMQKLGSLGFQQVQHAVQKCQCQPVPGSPDKVLVTVIGDMMVNGSQKVKFVEIFQLMKKPTGNWFVLNNTFNVIT